ncbi:MAG: pyridoxamine 5'-phosphate oxidase family protein [Dehalococcoidia bacterium]
MTDEQREFLRAHRLCIVGYERASGPPALSPVYYVMDGDDLIISTTKTRAKGKVFARETEVSLCVIGEQMPFPYVTVYGRGRIEEDGAADAMMRIGAVMSGNPVPESARPAVEERARTEQRVVLRVTPHGFAGR